MIPKIIHYKICSMLSLDLLPAALQLESKSQLLSSGLVSAPTIISSLTQKDKHI